MHNSIDKNIQKEWRVEVPEFPRIDPLQNLYVIISITRIRIELEWLQTKCITYFNRGPLL